MTTLRFTVTDADTAIALGSGDVPVLATPRLVAWMEAATVAAASTRVDTTSTTVGTEVWLRHRRPSAVGALVEVEVTEVTEQDRGLSFAVVAREISADGRCGGSRSGGARAAEPEPGRELQPGRAVQGRPGADRAGRSRRGASCGRSSTGAPSSAGSDRPRPVPGRSGGPQAPSGPWADLSQVMAASRKRPSGGGRSVSACPSWWWARTEEQSMRIRILALSGALAASTILAGPAMADEPTPAPIATAPHGTHQLTTPPAPTSRVPQLVQPGHRRTARGGRGQPGPAARRR